MRRTRFHSLSPDERRYALGFAGGESGRPSHLLEKDIWVVQLLGIVFATENGSELTFKSGTSVSKAYKSIHRFSEDIDITSDIRAIAADLIERSEGNPIPRTTCHARMRTDRIRRRLAEWVSCEMAPSIQRQLDEGALDAEVDSVEDKLIVSHEPLFPGYGYVRPEVLLEFGTRATGESREERSIERDVAAAFRIWSFQPRSRG